MAEEIRQRQERSAWGNTEQLLSGITTQLSLIRREQLAGLGVKGRNLPEPITPRRPGDPDPRKKVFSPREVFAMMQKGA